MLITLLLCAGLAAGGPTPGDQTTPRQGESCGYDSCTDASPDVLNVHIVAHTHDDVGWLKTVDQYYYGSRNNIQKACVKCILNSVVKELWEDPERKFIYVETAFFWKWWVAQPDSVQSQVHTLVRQGRLQFVGGAWSMNDEAASHYQSTIDQFTWGLQKLNDTFGDCGRPRVGWQIDPFGHSRELAADLALMGYDGLFLGRIDYQDKAKRLKDKTMEVLWRGSDDLGKSSDIFTGALYNTYSPPPGFCFDVLCNDEPIIDDVNSPMYNVDAKVAFFMTHSKELQDPLQWTECHCVFQLFDTLYSLCTVNVKIKSKNLPRDSREHVQSVPKQQYPGHNGGGLQLPGRRALVRQPRQAYTVMKFLEYVLAQSKAYRSNNVLVTMGGDFTYMDAFLWFDNLDRLIKYTNLKAAKENLNVKLFYSTPTCYLKAVKDANPSLPIKQDDYFPYASDPTAFWTGYFTSRPTTKRMEREGNNFLQTFKMLQVLTNLPQSNMFILNELKSAMGVMQHHDAITGTEKQHVTHDYERIVSQAVSDAYMVGTQALNKVIKPEVGLEYERCEFNQSQCAVTERSEAFIVTVFNNQAFSKSTAKVDLPVVKGAYSVYDEKGNKISAELQPLSSEYFSMPTRHSNATHNLCFFAKSLPGLGFKTYYVKKETEERTREKRDVNEKKEAEGRKVRDVNKKRVYDYYSNINDYWKDIRDKIETDIKNVETVVAKDDFIPKSDSVRIVVPKLENVPVPVRDNNKMEERDYDKNMNWDVLKDGDENNDEEIKGIIKEASRKLAEDLVRVGKDNKAVFASMSEDEMRMLSDEPMVVEEPQEIVLENEHITLTINKRTGWMNYSSKSDGTSLYYLPVPGYYIGCEGNNVGPANRSSGAYIFRPNMTASPDLQTFTNFVISSVIQSDKQEVRLHYDTSVCLTVGLKDDTTYFSSILNIDEGREYVLRFQTDLRTNGAFYTDSNGRQMLKRIRNKRPDWNLTLQEPIPGNYYPVVSEIYIEDDDMRVVLNVDRARGGASLKDGWMEIMQHRRLKRDDAFGVGEALNETAGGVGLYSIDNIILQIIPKNNDKLVNAAETSLSFFSEPQLFVAETTLSLDKFKTMKNEYSFLKNELPKGLHLLTLEPWKDGKILIRFENYLDKQLSPEFLSVDLSKVFKTIEIKSVKETTLAANRWLSDVEKWEWNTDTEFSESFNKEYGNEDVYRAKEPKELCDDGLTIKLRAKEIRTFVADYKVVN